MLDIAGLAADTEHVAVLLAGDVVHGMAHDVARPESSTGGQVDGSDLDLVVLAADDAPPALVDALGTAIHQRKWLYLRNPMLREEVDYVVKPLARLAEHGVPERLRALEGRAAEYRARREERLLAIEGDTLPPETRQQFWTDDEQAEFEHRH